jgi:cystathionine beta-lyase/cystathionine gamma-synthase
MAACTMVYLTYLSAGDHLILFHDIYGAHYKVSLILERLGIDITWLDALEGNKITDHLKPNTKMIFCESPSNPLCKILDISALVGSMLVVDNTFATPYHQKPLLLGADLVVHSATKALGGHNDLMAGAIAGSKVHYDKLWFTRQAIGTTLDAYSGSLLERGLKTFELRAEKMSANAMAMAEYLVGCPDVSQIRYPGLKSDSGHGVAKKQMYHGFGGVLAFDVGHSQEDAKTFISELKTIYHAVSLGATESLICIPYLTTLLYMPPERRTVFGVHPNTVRLSAGIEKTEILIRDLEQAIEKMKNKSVSRLRIDALQDNRNKKESRVADTRI